MKVIRTILAGAVAAAALAAVPAGAATFLGSSLAQGAGPQTLSNGGISAQFTGSGNFQYKDKTDTAASPNVNWRGVGIAGNTPGEIDIGEHIATTFTTGPVFLNWFQLMVLYDGPEFGDVQEVAQITVTPVVGSPVSKTLTINYVNANNSNAVWAPGPGTVTNLSPATEQGAAVWRVANPFGNLAITGIKFESLAGVSANICGPNGNAVCTNQTDYALHSIDVAAVPEPGTYALMLAGLAMLGFMVRRRTSV